MSLYTTLYSVGVYVNSVLAAPVTDSTACIWRTRVITIALTFAGMNAAPIEAARAHRAAERGLDHTFRHRRAA
jgi:hypothetical protein